MPQDEHHDDEDAGAHTREEHTEVVVVGQLRQAGRGTPAVEEAPGGHRESGGEASTPGPQDQTASLPDDATTPARPDEAADGVETSGSTGDTPGQQSAPGSDLKTGPPGIGSTPLSPDNNTDNASEQDVAAVGTETADPFDAVADELARYPYLHASRADMLRRLGRGDEARDAYERAIALTGNASERRFLEARLEGLRGTTGATGATGSAEAGSAELG